jgi:hypothetical protein
MRKQHRNWSSLIPAAAAGVALYWGIFGIAQTGSAPIATLFPQGPMLYVEAKDFAGLLAMWDASAEKKAWLESANYEAFERSHLALRLEGAQKEFAAAAGVPASYALVNSVAGGNTAIAMYKINELEFLYITRLPQARAIESALWKSRGTYQTRTAGGVTYYMKVDKASQRVAAFAYAGDLLILASKEELIAGALELRANASSRATMVSEVWFRGATQAAAPATDVRMVYNLEKLSRAFGFRTHWIQGNARELGEFSSGVTDLEIARGEFRERRVMLRAAALGDRTASEAAAGQLAALVPDDAGLHRVWAEPSAEEAAEAIEEKLFGAGVHAAQRVTRAPGAPSEPPPSEESPESERLAPEPNAGPNLETRIDEPALTDDRGAMAFRALRQALDGKHLEAMLEVGAARPAANQVFLRTEYAIVLQARETWDARAIEAALSSAGDGLWTTGGFGAAWRTGAGGVRELDGLSRLALAVDGRRLIVGTSAEQVTAVLARRDRAAAQGAVYAAEWRHARELPRYEQLMNLIDFPQIRPPAEGEQPGARPPLFFSENLASLGRILARVQSASIAVHDNGAQVRETVVYRLGQ